MGRRWRTTPGPPAQLPSGPLLQALARIKKLPNSAPLLYQRLCSTSGYDLDGAQADLAAAQGQGQGPPAGVDALARKLSAAVAGGQPGAVASVLECLSSRVSQELVRPGGPLARGPGPRCCGAPPGR
jgi:hypothetical protein